MGKFYTWPNPAFPFRLYFNDPKCRIFIIHNLTHNYDWLRAAKDSIRSTDFFYVTLAWHFSDHLAKTGSIMFKELGLDINQFHIMYNDLDEEIAGAQYGFRGEIINHNTWLDENIYKIRPEIEKIYDAIYIARRSEMKRHFLAADIENLALVAGGANHQNKICNIPTSKNDAALSLDAEGISNILNASRVGLCLSETEGACWSSSECLLSGVPVVSTHSQGGRSLWYNVNNSLIVEDSKAAVASGVQTIINKNFDAASIRSEHVKKQNFFRDRFKSHLSSTLSRFKVAIKVDEYFKDHFVDKMYTSLHLKEVLKTFGH
ncbi:hypothetical protein CL634_03725 [bacterium]|nr:hypothetical protein [bacterium]